MNGHNSEIYRVPPAGVWAPAITYFDPESDEVDVASQKKYYNYLSKHLAGLVILGTNAETFLLTPEERSTLLHIARDAVGPDYPIMAGVGGHSTKQVLGFIHDAVQAKADYVLVLPPAYFGKQTTNSVIMNFYDEIAEKSLLPIVIYNFPGVCNGVDMDSGMIAALAKRHRNIVGVKLTCASVGKITRLAALFTKEKFAVFGGQSDFLIAGLSVGSAGCIAAFANVFPKTISHVHRLYHQGKHDEALRIHQKAALAENHCKAGVAATKYAASIHSAVAAGIEGAEERLRPRRPYEAPDERAKTVIREALAETAEIERSL